MFKLVSLLIMLLFSLTSFAGFEHFISRDGHQLRDGNKIFRFAGLNAPELHRIEDDVKGVCKADRRGWGQFFKWPTSDEQQNWIKALVKSGHKATRIYVLSVEHPDDIACTRESHILKPVDTKKGNNQIAMPVLNETAMVVYDQMIAHASEQKLRLILPFIDHWQWWGGRQELAAFYDETQDDFYNVNSKTFSAYLDIIKQVITRKNTITGRYYYQEKAIMAWETGNELKDSTAEFVALTAAHIKSLAPNQLVVDGNYLSILEHSLNDPNIDIINNHFYTVNDNNKPQTIKDDLAKIAGKKVYLVGEYGLKPIKGIAEIMHTATHFELNGAQAAGAFIWGFRGHRNDGGFYFHREGNSPYYSYHLPGFDAGKDYQELEVTNLIRLAQAQMDGLSKAPQLPVPEPPVIRAISPDRKITWMGSPLGRSYRVERKQINGSKWHVIGDNISDGKNKFDPTLDTLFQDTERLTPGQTFLYRIVAKNESGESAPSNEIEHKVIAPNSFIQTINGQFKRDGKPYYFIGTNYWYGPLIAAKNGDRSRLTLELDQLQQIGVNNLRILVGADGGNGHSVVKPALQFQQGKYDLTLLEGLDYLLVEMKKRNMVAVLYLTNNWIWSGGMSQYLNWNGYGDVPNPFNEDTTWADYMSYTQQFHRCIPCTNAFYRHVEKIVTRTNSITGQAYNTDSTIMSWQLANEPRVFTQANYEPFKEWLDTSVALLKKLAPFQLVSTGNEGAAGSLNRVDVYQKLHDNPNIDYLTMHIWPKNWNWYQKYDKNNNDIQAESTLVAIEKAKQYMAEHVNVAVELNKPIVLSEFGFPRNLERLKPNTSTVYRDKFFASIFDLVLKSKNNSQVLAGLNFWAYGGNGHANPDHNGVWHLGDDYMGDPAQEPQGLNNVFSTDKKTLLLVEELNINLHN
ncbi:hypothetical protein KO525_07095 [Psychrosphaera sp. B3R10]|uniref:hypothetical protein n=1 Tax=unclassified Psychrosphaera TaxID=2641570 RepID=UPI001C080E70|nr:MULTISPECIES: hypothetical protein [unclassified Psychrosphaera]MBU2880539.1 hypothetical protein [Psychrosphaera sp. I2R16]MBU2989140.1 hypothetical protein [Psychrosphaera sp. B3R10]MDO6717797.1 hypothetical protein [Psychrosphaera sp. 1_MG-2023]